MEKNIFQCRQCGYCCQGETTVSLDKDDIERLVAHLRMPYEQVKEKYLRVRGNVTQMKTIDGHCIFYNNGCTIHTGKPWRCTQWPLHPSMTSDKSNFETIKNSCPGIKKNISFDEFRSKLNEVLESKKKEEK